MQETKDKWNDWHQRSRSSPTNRTQAEYKLQKAPFIMSIFLDDCTGGVQRTITQILGLTVYGVYQGCHCQTSFNGGTEPIFSSRLRFKASEAREQYERRVREGAQYEFLWQS